MHAPYFLVGQRKTPLYRIVRILDHVTQQEEIGSLALDDFMMERCGYQGYNFRIDIREQLRQRGFVKETGSTYMITDAGRKYAHSMARVLGARRRRDHE